MRRRPVSESVDPEDLIVSNTKKDLRSCERITHQSEVRPSIMRRMELLGVWRKSPEGEPSPQQPDAVDSKIAAIQGTSAVPERREDMPYTIWEIQCELDLPEFAPGKFKNEGIPLPYLVTLEKDNREIKAIRRDWREDDQDCNRKRLYVKWPWVPGPGFYGTGLLHILGNCSAAMTAAWRESLDAGMFANFPSGLVAKLGGRQNTSDIKLSPGVLQPIETSGMDIRAIVAPLPYKDITGGLLQLMQLITTQAQQVGSIGDMPGGEGLQNVPVGTMMAQIEQATKVIAAAHKGMHAAQAEELKLLVELFREHPDDFWRGNAECPPGYWDEQKFVEALQNCNLKPASDPNVPSHIHRVAKGVALVQLTTNPVLGPRLDPSEVLRRVLAAMREDVTGLILPPEAVAAAQQAAAQQGQGQGTDPTVGAARMLSAQSQAQKAQTDAQIDAAKLQLDQQKLVMEKQIQDTQLAKELVIHRSDAAKEQALALRQQQHEEMQHQRETSLEAMKTHQEAGLAASEQQQTAIHQAHERQMAEREHALATHEVLHPPKPSGKSG